MWGSCGGLGDLWGTVGRNDIGKSIATGYSSAQRACLALFLWTPDLPTLCYVCGRSYDLSKLAIFFLCDTFSWQMWWGVVTQCMDLEELPRKRSWYNTEPELPVNLKWEIGFDVGWTKDRQREIMRILGLKEEDAWLMFSDGSVKEYVGGDAYFICKWLDYDKIDWTELEEGYYDFTGCDWYGAGNSVSLRTSIDFCEMFGMLHGLKKLNKIKKKKKLDQCRCCWTPRWY